MKKYYFLAVAILYAIAFVFISAEIFCYYVAGESLLFAPLNPNYTMLGFFDFLLLLGFYLFVKLYYWEVEAEEIQQIQQYNNFTTK